MKNKSQK